MSTKTNKNRTQKKKSWIQNPLNIGLAGLVIVILIALGAWGLSNPNQAGSEVSESPEGTVLPAFVTVDQAYALQQEGAFVLDVRTQQEWDEYHAPGTTLIPLDQLANRVDELPRDKDIVVICRSGNRSQEGRDILKSVGFDSVTSVNGGLLDWRASGYPTTSP